MTSANLPTATVLFVCTGNAGRSQLAQAYCESLGEGRVRPWSAGVRPWRSLHPMAVRILNDGGLDHGLLYPKSVERFVDQAFDVVVTIGDQAKTELPRTMRERTRHVHWDIADPADADGTLASEPAFRLAAKELRSRVAELVADLQSRLPASTPELS